MRSREIPMDHINLFNSHFMHGLTARSTRAAHAAFRRMDHDGAPWRGAKCLGSMERMPFCTQA